LQLCFLKKKTFTNKEFFLNSKQKK
jgi:hypothetical protein